MPRDSTEHHTGRSTEHSGGTAEYDRDRAADFTPELTGNYEERKSASEHFGAVLREEDGNLTREIAAVYERTTDTRQASWMNQEWNEPSGSGERLMLAYRDAALGLNEHQQHYLASEIARTLAMPVHESSTSFSQDWDLERLNAQVFDQRGYDLLMEKAAQGFRNGWQDAETRIADSLYEARDRDVSMMKFGDIEQPVDHRMAYLYAVGELQDLQRDIDQAALHGVVPEEIRDPELREEIEAMKMARGEKLLEAHVRDLARAMPEPELEQDPESVLSYTRDPGYPAALRDFAGDHSQGDQQLLLEQISAAKRTQA